LLLLFNILHYSPLHTLSGRKGQDILMVSHPDDFPVADFKKKKKIYDKMLCVPPSTQYTSSIQ